MLKDGPKQSGIGVLDGQWASHAASQCSVPEERIPKP